MILFCDSLVKMKIVKIEFMELGCDEEEQIKSAHEDNDSEEDMRNSLPGKVGTI